METLALNEEKASGPADWVASVSSVCSRHGVALCYLYGSVTLGQADGRSDVDLGVVFFDRPTETDYGPRWNRLCADLEPCVAPRSLDLVFLQLVGPQLRFTAIREGQLLHCADDTGRADFVEWTTREWQDWREVAAANHADFREALQEGYFYAEPPAH